MSIRNTEYFKGRGVRPPASNKWSTSIKITDPTEPHPY